MHTHQAREADMEWLPVQSEMIYSLMESTIYSMALDQKWRNFCNDFPDQCGRERVIFEVEDEVAINKINCNVNKFPYTGDEVDYWTCDASGDCEDKALEKRRLLNAELGIPLGAMSLMIVRNRNNIVHAVLVLHTTKGDYVLDNENAFILPWDRCNFNSLHFICIENDWYSFD